MTAGPPRGEPGRRAQGWHGAQGQPDHGLPSPIKPPCLFRIRYDNKGITMGGRHDRDTTARKTDNRTGTDPRPADAVASATGAGGGHGRCRPGWRPRYRPAGSPADCLPPGPGPDGRHHRPGARSSRRATGGQGGRRAGTRVRVLIPIDAGQTPQRACRGGRDGEKGTGRLKFQPPVGAGWSKWPSERGGLRIGAEKSCWLKIEPMNRSPP